MDPRPGDETAPHSDILRLLHEEAVFQGSLRCRGRLSGAWAGTPPFLRMARHPDSPIPTWGSKPKTD